METIAKEKLSEDDCYKKIMEMTLNTSVDEVLEILYFVQSNYYMYFDLFFNNLYVLVEKEKYLKAKFGVEPKLYPRLNIQAKEMLRTLFIQNLNEYSGQEKNMIASELDLLGYEKVIDQRCQSFFDKCEFENRQTFDLDEGKCHAYYKGTTWEYWPTDKFIVKVSDRRDLHVCPDKHDKRDKEFVITNLHGRDDSNNKYYFIQNDTLGGYGPVRQCMINRNTGERIRIPNKIFYPQYSLGCFFEHISSNDFTPRRVEFYNENFEKIYAISDVTGIHIDYRLGLFIVCKASGTVEIYDKDFNLDSKKKFKLESSYSIASVNDGIMVLGSFDKKKVIYYDYIERKEIDSFAYYGSDAENFAYSEGLYNCVNKDGKFGYKNLDHEFVIDPIYYMACPFLGNVARATLEDERTVTTLFLNKTGKGTPELDVFDKLYQAKLDFFKEFSEDELMNPYGYLKNHRGRLGFTSDFDVAKYQLRDYYVGATPGFFKGYLVVQDNYVANVDTPILKIDFEGKNKGFEKVDRNLID